MRIAVNCDMSVTVTLPFGFGSSRAEDFVRQKSEWIEKSLEYFKKFKGKILVKPSKRDYLANRDKALTLVNTKILEWNQFYNFSPRKIKIKNQKTRWGSCSKRGNLNFNYKIVYLSEDLLNYLVVHELCHLKEMNHSWNFWNLVARTIPNYKKLRAELKNFQLYK